MNDDIKILRGVHGSAQADGSASFGRISFRLSRAPERRWIELFDAGKGKGISTEERSNDCLLHVECVPGEVAGKRDAMLALIADVNSRWRAEVDQQATRARDRHDQKRRIEEALNLELDALTFDRE